MDLSYLQGEVLDGRFRLDALAGQGGFGAVFRGTQLSVDRTCAVKVVAPELATNETSLDRFRVEARATSRLSNPHTVVLFDFGRDPERSVLFLAMEWLDGGDLRDVVQRSGPLTFGATAKVVDQVAQSLSEAHQTGAVHRDIKPRNV
ncbi:MAG: serine/threonine-protein kinase, partial [Bradymonadaceae bacterium]